MNLKQATQLLKESNSSCIILKNNQIIYTSFYSGVKPLLLFLKEKVALEENDQLVLIDKVIGKAALLLAVKCKVEKLYTPVISSFALDAAKHHKIECIAKKTVPYIINREGNDICPIESSVIDTLDIGEAYLKIISTINSLMKI